MVQRLGVFVAAGLLAVATPAAADVITAADVLRIGFQSDAYPPTVNEFTFGVGFMTLIEPNQAIQATLFLNGSFTGTSTINTRIFGTGLVHFTPVAIWRSPSSPLDPQFLDEAIVNLGKLSSGPVAGAVVLRLIGGAGNFDFTQFSFSVTERRPGGFGTRFEPPAITFVEINPETSPTPEPATLILVGTGIAAAVRRRRRVFPA
jgi:hypothetical protein